MPWADTVVFHMDEYVGVGPDHPAGFQRWIRERIVEPARPRDAYYVEGLGDAEAECAPLQRRSSGAIRSTCAASASARTGIWPSTTRRWPTSPTRATSRWSSSRPPAACSRCNEGHFPDLDAVPTHAITVTIPALLRAGRVLADRARSAQGESRSATH